MAGQKQKQCAHIPCQCEVPPHQTYCGDVCEFVGKEDIGIACECGHRTCPLTV
jgi:hypothetical protein